MAALHHAYQFTDLRLLYQPNPLSPAHTEHIKLTAHTSGLWCMKASPVLSG